MSVEHRFAHIPDEASRGRAWVASHAPLAAVSPRTTVPLDVFHRYHHLGEAVLGTFEAPDQVTERTEALAIRQALDLVVLRTPVSGQAHVTAGEASGVVGQGDIVLLDLGRPFRIEAAPMRGIDLFLPRRVLTEGRKVAPLPHGRILRAARHPLVRLVSDHLRNLPACLGPAPVGVPSLGPATLVLCRALFAATADEGGDAPDDRGCIAMRRFIEENLATVDIPLLMARFGLSRTVLYQRFDGQEGVAAYIRGRRLAAAMRALLKPGRRPKLARLAYQCGFANPRAFSRAFRRRYGIWPADVSPVTEGPGTLTSLPAPMAWLRDL